MSKVSVVVPVFNAEKTLEKCIKSILNQTFKDFELILVNDGSTDNSLNVCKRYELFDERIIVINKENEGCIKTRRRGIEASKTEFIMFVDADDWIHKDTIKILLNEIIKDDLDVVVCNYYKVVGSHLSIKRKNNSPYLNEDKIYKGNEVRKELVVAYLHGHPFPANLFAKLYKKDLLIASGNYLEKIKFLGEDLYYNLEIFLKAKKVKVLKRTLYYYRYGGNTSKYMDYLLDDATTGYQIQKEVIEKYFVDTKQIRYNGISIMLLNYFKTFLFNLFFSTLNEIEKKAIIGEKLKNKMLQESTLNKRSREYFPNEYILAINKGDVDFLYNLGETIYKDSKLKRSLISLYLIFYDY